MDNEGPDTAVALVPSGADDVEAASGGPSLTAQVDKIKEELEMEPTMKMPSAIRAANAQMGLPDEGTWPQQAAALIAALGV